MATTTSGKYSVRPHSLLARHAQLLNENIPITAEDQDTFTKFFNSIEYGNIVGDYPYSFQAEDRDNAIIKRLGHAKLSLFNKWSKQRRLRMLHAEDAWAQSSPSPTEIGEKIDRLSINSRAHELTQLDNLLSNRRTPVISLGTWNNYEIRFIPRFHELEMTYLSLEDRNNDAVRPEASTPDQHVPVPLLLSLYRNCNEDKVSSGSSTSAGSVRSSESGSSYGDPILRDYVRDRSISSTFSQRSSSGTSSFSQPSVSDISEESEEQSESLISDPSSPDWARWPYRKVRHPNVLRKMLPLGPVEYRSVEHKDDGVVSRSAWHRTSWNLVMNIDDKTPWLVFTAFQQSDEGQVSYYGPGSRLAGFCGETVPFSHAKLNITKTSGELRSSSFWTDVFRDGGTFDRQVGITTIYQDASFAIGDVVWSHTDRCLQRPGDDLPYMNYEMEGMRLGGYNIHNPPHPEYSAMDTFPIS